MKKYIFFILSFFVIQNNSFAETIQLIGKDKFNIGLKSYLLEDKEGKLTIDDVMKSGDFKKSKKASPNFGFTNSAIWCKFEISVPDDEEKWFLEIGSPIADIIDFYEFKDEKILQNYILGDHVPFSKRKIDYKNCVFPLTSKKGIYTYYYRVATTGSLTLPMTIYNNKSLISEINQQKILSGFYYGMLFVMMVFNLLFTIYIRQLTQLYYVIIIFCFIIASMILDGIGFQHFWGNNLYINKTLPFLLCFSMTNLFQFTRAFLETKKTSPVNDKMLMGLIYVSFFCAVISFFLHYNIIIKPAALLVVVAFTILTITGVIYSKKDIREGKFYLYAFIFLLIGCAITVLNRFGVLASNTFTVWSFKIGITGQIVLLTLAFADQINHLKNELAVLNVGLEHKVQERTEELEASYSELEATNEQLIKTRDALWGEMELAKKIQTVLLPVKPQIDGYDIAVYQEAADEVGGDYYDVINVEGRDWIIIGDVSGHGVPAGLIMMMVQTAIQVTLAQHSNIETNELLSIINRIITKNIKNMKEDKYMSITVLASFKDGDFYFSGLHQDLMIYRSQKSEIELVETKGMWIGLMDDIENMLEKDKINLGVEDTLLVFTDGVTEAVKVEYDEKDRLKKEKMYGQVKLEHLLKSKGESSVEEIKSSIVESLESYRCDDDVSFVVIKRKK